MANILLILKQSEHSDHLKSYLVEKGHNVTHFTISLRDKNYLDLSTIDVAIVQQELDKDGKDIYRSEYILNVLNKFNPNIWMGILSIKPPKEAKADFWFPPTILDNPKGLIWLDGEINHPAPTWVQREARSSGILDPLPIFDSILTDQEATHHNTNPEREI